MITRNAGDIRFSCGRWPLDADKPTVVFVHGAGGSNTLWHRQVDALAECANTVAPDLPGHGDSGGKGCRRVVDYASAVSAFLETIQAPRPIPCGLSMGGAIALQMLLDHPRRYPAGILISTGARLKVLPVIFEAIENDYQGFVDMLNRFAFSPATGQALRRGFLEDAAACAPETALGDFQACDGFDVTRQLSAIDVPVLVVTAEDDQLTPAKYGAFLEEKLARAVRRHIPAAGHIIPLEQPEALNREMTSFLSTLPVGDRNSSA
jgi:pimeloyl-ACP methyl ester carboxylesterase